jgi:hypothetical protein
MRMLLVTEYLVKQLKYSYGCGQLKIVVVLVCCISYQWVLLNYSALSPERQGKGTKGNNSINTEDGIMAIVHCTSFHCTHCMKLYWILTTSFQVMHRKKK